MAWPPYDLTPISDEARVLRRQTLDLYGCIAHYSALAPAVAFLLFRLVRRAVGSGPGPGSGSGPGPGRYEEVPRSPVAKAQRRAPSGAVAAWWQRLRWWLRDDVCLAGLHWGQRDEWLLGLAWMAWLLALCILGTGTDYFHLTKRFGTIAISQFPIQYLLSLKALNPFAWVFGSSHESVNRFHRVLGRIIYALLVIHMLLYNVYWIVFGTWLDRFFAPIVFAGVVAFLSINALTAAAFDSVRRYSYRLFFVTHVLSALLIPVLIFFHAPSARLYLAEMLVAFFLDLAVRKVTTITCPSTLDIVPGTNLVKVSSAIPLPRLGPFRASPGSHVYLSIPSGSRARATPASRSSVLFDFLYNPFTVASVDEDHATITLVVRTRDGPMTAALGRLASSTPGLAADGREILLAIEGPYGAMGKQFDDLLGWGAARILLVAGGVGATFALSMYRAIQAEAPSAKVQLIWAVRGAGDASWAVSSGGEAGKSVLDDEGVELFITGVTDDSDDAAGDALPMELLHGDGDGRFAADRNRRRPDIKKMVDDTFRQGLEEPVAVLVCGPAEMAREVKRRVRPWAMRGRKVWWHSESFGW